MIFEFSKPFSSCYKLVLALIVWSFSSQLWAAIEIPDGLQFAIQQARLLEGLDTEEDALGTAVSISGDFALVGARNADLDDSDIGQLGNGAAYIYTWLDGAWVQTAELVADDGAAVDQFGSSVSLSGDWAVVGAPNHAGKGAVYVFRHVGNDWLQDEKLTASNGSASDNFGGSVSVDGDRLLVGASSGDGNVEDSGTAYVFEHITITTFSVWAEVKKIQAQAGAWRDYFGASVSLSGGRALIGAYGDDQIGALSGAAYIFEGASSNWAQKAKLIADDTNAGDWFGWRVSLDGGRALISTAHDDNQAGDVDDQGSAYIFDGSGESWSQTQKLYPGTSSQFFNFGSAVSLAGDRAVIGNYGDPEPTGSYVGNQVGSAYVFQRNSSSGIWQETDKLFAADAEGRDEFGRAVAVDGVRVLVGAPREDEEGEDAGAAYAFTHDGSNWSQTQKLKVYPVYDDNHFGYAVSIFGNRALIGAYGNDDFGEDAGSAGIFELNEDGIWEHIKTLYAGDAQAGDQFGFSVALTENSAVVGANLEDSEGDDAGAAYVFEYDTAAAQPIWRQDAKITAGTASSQFGFSVGHSPGRVVVGAPFSQGTGTAYVFSNGAGFWSRTALAAGGLVEFDNYGYSVSAGNRWILIGANGDGFTHGNQGAVYVFQPQLNGTWNLQTRLTASDGEGSDAFGHSVGINFDRAIIGAPYKDSIRGRAYIFDYVNDAWGETQKLSPADETNFGRFGWSVSVYSDRAIIGAYQDGAAGDDAGSAYIFNRLENTWIQTKKFIANEIGAGDYFGNSVSVSLSTMLLGAPNLSNENGANAGVAYIYRQAGSLIYADGFETAQ